MRTIVLVLCATLSFAFTASASETPMNTEILFPQQMSARDLMMTCASSSLTANGRVRRRYCEGFVAGVEEGMRLFQLIHSINAAPAICVPIGTTSRQLTETFVTYASRKGVDLKQPAAAVVIKGLENAFICN
jgi:hypothetical protein